MPAAEDREGGASASWGPAGAGGHGQEGGPGGLLEETTVMG